MVKGALRNPQAVVAFGLMVLILGAVSYQKMVVDIFPEINIPVVAVATFYKGMGPSEMEGAITLRLEQLFLQASYVEHIESRTLPGVSLIKVFFHSTYDVNAGVAEITSLAYSALRYLPKGVTPPTIIKFGASSLPIANLTVSSETMSEKEVRDIAYFSIRPQLGTVPGVSVPPTFGGRVRQITISLNQEQMLARGISAQDIVKAVNAANLLIPTGNVKIGDFDYNVYSNSLVETISDLNALPIKIINGVPVFLRDTAIAQDSTAVQVNVVRVNGRRAVYIPILKQAGANTIAVIDGIKAALPNMTGIPADIETKLIFDQSLYIRQAITSLQHEGLLGGGLACLMILLFLGQMRAMLVIALAIPLSITAAFTLLFFSGQSINIMTLGGLALSVGLLVDNSIVVQENIHRHRGLGTPPGFAALRGAQEVMTPMLVITISILIVYLPIAFFTGVIKFLFIPLALAVAFAMGASYIASMTVVPVAAALFDKEQHDAAQGHHLFDRFVNGYEILLRWGIRHRGIVITGVIMTIVGTAAVVPRLATEFFPRVDAGEFILHVTVPDGTRLEKTEAIVAQIEDIITANIPPDQLDQVVSNIGLPQGWMVLMSPVNGPHQGFILVSLTHGHTISSWTVIDRIRKDVRHTFPGVKIAFQTGGVVSDVLNFGSPAPIDIKISGRTLDDLHQAALDIQNAVRDVPGTVDVRIHQGMAYPELYLKVDRTKAAYQGLTQQDIVAEVTTGLSSNISLNPGYWIDPASNNAYAVVAQYPEQTLNSVDDFLNIPIIAPATTTFLRRRDIPASSGYYAEGDRDQPTSFLLKDLATVERRVGPEIISHYNLQRTVDVLANVRGNDLGGIAQAVEDRLRGITLPEGVSISLRGELEGMRNAMLGFAIMLPLTIVLIYLLMLAFFRSFLSPLIIMFTVPLGFIGVVWMLLVTDTSVNVQSLIGILMMIGIVVSNGILLVDFANTLVKQGTSPYDAIIEAGRLRLRPIIMTALAASLGLLPMALGIGEGSESNAPLARSVIGGLMVSTPMTLFFVPILYTLLTRYRPRNTA